MQGLGWRRVAAEGVLGVLLPLAVARIEPLVERLPSLGLLRALRHSF
jgi:hypothetical protein